MELLLTVYMVGVMVILLIMTMELTSMDNITLNNKKPEELILLGIKIVLIAMLSWFSVFIALLIYLMDIYKDKNEV